MSYLAITEYLRKQLKNQTNITSDNLANVAVKLAKATDFATGLSVFKLLKIL